MEIQFRKRITQALTKRWARPFISEFEWQSE